MRCFLLSLLLLLYKSPSVAFSPEVSDSTLIYLSNYQIQDSILLPTGITTATRDRKVRFGVKLSLGTSKMNFNKGFQKSASPIDASWNVGVGAGAIIEVPVWRKLNLRQEYAYTYLRGEPKGEDLKYSLSYLSFPVVVKYHLFRKFSLLAGPQFDLLLYAKEKFEGISLNIIHETEERNIGLFAGVEYQLLDSVSVDARFMRGINHINIKYGKTYKEYIWESLQVSIVLSPHN